ncbi:NYN domain-containing protein [Thalassoroseus pseudoceratinae]|uniref:NYN domain-containing protein n=1 Tax=Thalassoroseus pseudoceratinae TaxID=2713176 RepID=UPI001422B840|nr:NYN domain-containing protein [Thalassoroseus pseudoceratinae]
MAKPFVIIDGYNLMHAAGFAKHRYGPGGLERAREQFLRALVGMVTPEMQPRTTVVFDAFDSPGNDQRKSRRESVTVVFAGAGGDADSLIETLIAEHSAPRQVRVVSDDRRLKRAARKRKARPWSSLDYWEKLVEHADRRSRLPQESEVAPEKYEGQPAPAEVRHWLNIFGAIFPSSRKSKTATPTPSASPQAKPTPQKTPPKSSKPKEPPPSPKTVPKPSADIEPTDKPDPNQELDIDKDELAFWENRVRELDDRNPE